MYSPCLQLHADATYACLTCSRRATALPVCTYPVAVKRATAFDGFSPQQPSIRPSWTMSSRPAAMPRDWQLPELQLPLAASRSLQHCIRGKAGCGRMDLLVLVTTTSRRRTGGDEATCEMAEAAVPVLVMLPSVTPPAAAAHWAPVRLARHEQTLANTPNSHQRCRQGRGRGSVKMVCILRYPLGEVVREVQVAVVSG
jgi:hypothetical protein